MDGAWKDGRIEARRGKERRFALSMARSVFAVFAVLWRMKWQQLTHKGTRGQGDMVLELE